MGISSQRRTIPDAPRSDEEMILAAPLGWTDVGVVYKHSGHTRICNRSRVKTVVSRLLQRSGFSGIHRTILLVIHKS